MKKEIADAWVKDLRTNPPQTQGVLFDGTGHCCLGRLCLVLGYKFNELDRIEYVDTDGSTEMEAHVLPPPAMIAAGMYSRSGEFEGEPDDDCYRTAYELTDLNDNGETFAEIADIIEKHWEQL